MGSHPISSDMMKIHAESVFNTPGAPTPAKQLVFDELYKL